MLTGGLFHALVAGFTGFFGFLMGLIPSVPGWITGGATQIHVLFQHAGEFETWIPISEAVGVAKDVTLVWGAAAMIAWARLAYRAITNRNG